MKDISKPQIFAMHSLLRLHGLMDDKANIVEEISKGRTRSVAGLHFNEAHEWISAMNKRPKPDAGEKESKDKMIRHIFAMAHELGWIIEEAIVVGSEIKKKKNYKYVHEWIAKYGYLKKPLNKYTYKELPTLVTAFKNMYTTKMQRS